MTHDDYKDRILAIEQRLQASRKNPCQLNAASARELYFELQRLARSNASYPSSSPKIS